MKQTAFKVNTVFMVKNMVSNSCIRLIKIHFSGFDDIDIVNVRLGEAELSYNPKTSNAETLRSEFKNLGFPVILDRDDRIVENIKIAAIELIHYAYNTNSLIRNSDYLSEKLNISYSHLSKLFSEKTGTTLEKYLILLKIEKVKELVLNGDYTLSEIAFMMGYSSVHYLSNQFKKIAGVSVSEYKTSPVDHRLPLDGLLN